MSLLHVLCCKPNSLISHLTCSKLNCCHFRGRDEVSLSSKFKYGWNFSSFWSFWNQNCSFVPDDHVTCAPAVDVKTNTEKALIHLDPKRPPEQRWKEDETIAKLHSGNCPVPPDVWQGMFTLTRRHVQCGPAVWQVQGGDPRASRGPGPLIRGAAPGQGTGGPGGSWVPGGSWAPSQAGDLSASRGSEQLPTDGWGGPWEVSPGMCRVRKPLTLGRVLEVVHPTAPGRSPETTQSPGPWSTGGGFREVSSVPFRVHESLIHRHASQRRVFVEFRTPWCTGWLQGSGRRALVGFTTSRLREAVPGHMLVSVFPIFWYLCTRRSEILYKMLANQMLNWWLNF